MVNKLSFHEATRLQKITKAFLFTVPQIIVQSRCGQRRSGAQKKIPNKTSVLELAIENNAEIEQKVKQTLSTVDGFKEFDLCIEILLHTANSDKLGLEVWDLCVKQSEIFWHPEYRVWPDEVETAYANLLLLLKSVTSVTRSTPAFKLSLMQSSDTYVMLYKIYSGQPVLISLGTKPKRTVIGEVFSPLGLIRMAVAYRTKHEMTIAPNATGTDKYYLVRSHCSVLGNSTEFSSEGNEREKMDELQKMGAFASSSSVPDRLSSDLELLEKSFLNIPDRKEEFCPKYGHYKVADIKDDENGNLLSTSLSSSKTLNANEASFEQLSCSDSDLDDFVLVQMKPSFACNNDDHIGAFFQKCENAPILPSLTNQGSLEEQVSDITNQLANFEIIKDDIDSFVDSICKSDIKHIL